MDIKRITGVNESEEILLTKGISDLIFSCNLPLDEIKNERISVFVETASGSRDICRNVLLKDFILLGTFQEDIVQFGKRKAEFMQTIAKIELTEDGGFIELFENETIKFKLTNLQSNKVYALDGIEGAFPTKEILRYERKVVSANVTSQDYDVRGYDLISLKKHEDIEEIDFRMDNGTTIKMTPFEMETESKAIDTFAFFKRISFADTDNETIEFQMPQHGIPDRIVFPLVGVNSITIRKNTGNDLDLHLRIDEGDYNQYGHKFAKN